MTKHFCDKCNKECDWRDMVRISADRDLKRGIKMSIEIHKLYELCEECYRKIFVAKEGDEE